MLAAEQKVTARRGRGHPLASRLSDNSRVLTDCYRGFAKAAAMGQAVTPAAEWLLDNFHVVDDQIREIRDDLPPGYYRKLPKLAEGPLAGYPRVFGIAWALVAHTDSAIDLEKLTRFVEAYQQVQPLTIGELWALAITLRVTLVENLRRVAETIAARLAARNRADVLADRILGTDTVGPVSTAAALKDLGDTPWSMAFAVQLAQRLRDRDPAVTPALHWLIEALAGDGEAIEDVVRDQVQRQSAMNVTVRNIINSMRLISVTNWAEFFEAVSAVDRVMRRRSDFTAMDFATRDLYRRAIEDLARCSDREETDVAERALAAARQVDSESPQDRATLRETDLGYYLISMGRPAFERTLGCRRPISTWLFRLNADIGVSSYVAMVAFGSVLILALGLAAAAWGGGGEWALLALAVAGAFPASDLAVAAVNRLISQSVGAMPLPGLELRHGVPAEMSTIIVVPTLLTSVESVMRQIERLEVHHLANPDDHFSFALLSDWTDSPTEHRDGDDVLVAEAQAGIDGLNARYPSEGDTRRFHLLHRRRVWTASEGSWIGWERKRGKLHELNRLLRGATDTTFLWADGRSPALPVGVRFVITVDSDTRLPIGAARRLVGKIAHPLNQPFFNPRTGLVAHGHAILQPRVAPSLPVGSEGTLFQRVFSGPNGLDPYALAVSDIYQDLFEEGSYCGKGVYEIDPVEAALAGQIPESAVLSHDLLEGVLARAGLVSDIEVVEEFPSRYAVAAARQHRWVRGDWQLLPWIFAPLGASRHGRRRTRLPLMGRWKLLDNLRRSLSAPAAVIALIVGWMLPVEVAGLWTAFILLTIALPPLLPAIAGLLPRRGAVSIRAHLRGLWDDLALGLVQSAFLITFLAHQAWLMTDAAVRMLCRLFIHRRRLLEWVTAAQSDSDLTFSPRALTAQLAAALLWSAGVAALVALEGRGGWLFAAPLLAAWAVSPLIAYWTSAPTPIDARLVIAAPDALTLRLIARRTWRFFEVFITPEDHMLPPDNFQEDPLPVVAHRTSPTNVGLYLLSVAAARDFGWIGLVDTVDRLEATLATLERLEQHRGHFFNWYDTSDLRALEPKYVSSVDSGNLAGHLIALAVACQDMALAPGLHAAWTSGLEDTLCVLQESLAAAGAGPGDGPFRPLMDSIEATLTGLRHVPAGLAEPAARLEHLAGQAAVITDRASACAQQPAGEVALAWATAFARAVAAHRSDAQAFLPTPAAAGASRAMSLRLTRLAVRLKAMAMAMEFGFLYDEDRQLFSIGYRPTEGEQDPSFYDLLASEARLASFFAIAKGDVPAKHWFRLGRTMTPINAGSALISWSGSMFEYLMPSLVMRAPAGSLLERTNRLVVARQEAYGASLRVPWGMSESEYNTRDIEQTYQYSSFGVPDLGYKRGLSESTVIAPYASGLAAMIDPGAAARNFRRMADLGARGAYGWVEAIDYTRSRLPAGKTFAIVGAFMAHHQAMTILGLGNALHGGLMRERFHSEPMVQAAELLLQERMPRGVALARRPLDPVALTLEPADLPPEIERRYSSPHSAAPRTHLQSNGRYAVMVTAAGSGYSRWRDIAITRWREDPTRDDWGSFVFLRDVDGGATWSAGYQPCGTEADAYDVTFSEDRSTIIRDDGAITTTLEIAISPEDDAEVRRVSITNHGARTREIEVTSYAELALARPQDDTAHPAFSKLFVMTEFVAGLGAILATRRARSAADPVVWAAHLAVVEGEAVGDLQFETDRARFIGRGRTARTAAAITERWPLSGALGAVLDPVFSLRRRVRIPRGSTVRIAFWTLAAGSRDDVVALADKHKDPGAFERAATLAWTQAQMQLHHLGVGLAEAHLFQRLANHVLYSDASLRPAADVLRRGAGKASTLWGQGLSGDLPIILVCVSQATDLELVRQLLHAHEYWRLKQLAVDLVILNERATSYDHNLEDALKALLRTTQSAPAADLAVRGGVFLLRADIIGAEACDRLRATARAVLHGDRGSLADQIDQAHSRPRPASAMSPPPAPRPMAGPVAEPPPPRVPMEFFNGRGGFINDGRDYLTILDGDGRTPAPWVNVIANPVFGFQVSTEGSGFTWALNSQQNQVTPWSNDPVGDTPGEAIYLRDEDTSEFWSPTSLPIRIPGAPYSARHGQGLTTFEHQSHGLALTLTQFAPVDDPIKISRLAITNQSGRARRLSVTAYVEWVLGANRAATAPFVMTQTDPETGALFAVNPSSDQFAERVAFLDMKGQQTSWTGDRAEFLGRNGDLRRPLALASGAPLSNQTGPGLDPCGVLRAPIAIAPGATVEIVICLGQAQSRPEASRLLVKYRKADLGAVLDDVVEQWDGVLGVVQVKTPDRALDVMMNRWLPYQVLACRVWGRAGFYQASGAYGFRDQLQDVMALCISRPDVAREHILRAAARQFVEGDVQHWWLPESGRGVRTLISDDRIWLAYVVAHYVRVTGDTMVLDVDVPFLEGPVLAPESHEAFFEPAISGHAASLFDHCALALDHSLAVGAHGLPLMGTGDWNDGLDRVGGGGKGESVWLAWLLCSTLESFSGLADSRADAAGKAATWRAAVAELARALDAEGWDGDWYRRAYFDDGSPLGSVANSQCRIDSISQSWAVIAGVADPDRAGRAMEAVDRMLISEDEQLALLFTPPFDHPAQDPGYIKGYPPGLRENGGQYTHAAAWAAMAFAMRGDGDRAGQLLSMLNPIRHSETSAGAQRYKVEPYVVSADVYSVAPHVGRGGWTWYTGAAGWLYNVALERVLGFRPQGDSLVLDPCIPRHWRGFQIVYRHRSARYEISVENPLGVCRGILTVRLDGVTLARGASVTLVDDGATHKVMVVLGEIAAGSGLGVTAA